MKYRSVQAEYLLTKIKKHTSLTDDHYNFILYLLKDEWFEFPSGYSYYIEEILRKKGIKHKESKKKEEKFNPICELVSKMRLTSEWKKLSEHDKTIYNFKVRDAKINKIIDVFDDIPPEQATILRSILIDDFASRTMKKETKNMDNPEFCKELYHESTNTFSNWDEWSEKQSYRGLGLDLSKDNHLYGFKSEIHINFYRMNTIFWVLGTWPESAAEISTVGHFLFHEFPLSLKPYRDPLLLNELVNGQLDLIVSLTSMILVWDEIGDEIELEAPVMIREIFEALNSLYYSHHKDPPEDIRPFTGLVEISPGRFEPTFGYYGFP